MKQVFGVVLIVLLCGSVYGQSGTNPSSASGDRSGRIVNGQTASIETYPFMAKLTMQDGLFLCGATIVTYKHVVTAAHCLDTGLTPADLRIQAGSSNLSEGTVFEVKSFKTHPNWNPNTLDYDAAIVTIVTYFGGHPNIAPILLQETPIDPSTSPSCYTLGWGVTNPNLSQNPLNLQFTNMQLGSRQDCVRRWSNSITDRMICANSKNSSTCYGDNGGPLVCNDRLVGITSRSQYRCQTSDYSVFTHIPSVFPFIKSKF